MKALFVELPAFDRYRQEYLSDEAYRGLQNELLKAPKDRAALKAMLKQELESRK
jgi:hypothetical protein